MAIAGLAGVLPWVPLLTNSWEQRTLEELKPCIALAVVGAVGGWAFWRLDPKTTHTPSAFKVALSSAALLLVAAGAPLLAQKTKFEGELQDPAVRVLGLRCGTDDEPAGTGMPAWPDRKQQFYSRQHWTPEGALKVEVWEFLSPGYVLVSANRHIDGNRIFIEPRWAVPPDGPVAACYAKYGIEVTFDHLPRGDYIVEPR